MEQYIDSNQPVIQVATVQSHRSHISFTAFNHLLQLCLSIVCFIGIQPAIIAQDYTVKVQHFGVEDGLLHRDITSIFEDQDGFIWVGTAKGVQRFDGHEFKSWTKTDKSGLIYHITSIGQDQDGWLWLWNNHLYTFVFLHPVTEEIQTIEERFGDDFPIQRIGTNQGWHFSSSQLITDDQGRLYFILSNPNKLVTYDSSAGFQTTPLDNISSGFLKLYLVDSGNNLWLSQYKTNPSVYQIDTLGNILQKHDFSYNQELGQITEKEGEFYYEINTPEIRSFYKIDKEGNQTAILDKKRVPLNGRYHLSLIWENNTTGWSLYEDTEESPVLFISKEKAPKSFDNIRVFLFEDSQGRVWLPSAWGLGLAIVKPKLFQPYFSFPENEQKPLPNSSRGIFVDQDILYANFEFGGLVRIPKKQPDAWSVMTKSNNELLYYGRPLIRPAKGGLYTGNVDPKVLYISPEQKKRTPLTFQDKNQNWFLSGSWCLYEDKKEGLWVGMFGGLAYKAPHATYLEYIDNNENFITNQVVVLQIAPTKDGHFWLCSTGGLHLFDPVNKHFLADYHEGAPSPYYLPASIFHYLYIDQDNIHWLATDQGLIRWDKTTNEHRLFTTIDGLSNDVIYAIFEDDYNNLWLSSDYGIMQFDKDTYHVNAYLEEDGITHQEFNKISAFQEADGTIYFGGLNGITSFHPRDFRSATDSIHQKMLITGFEVYDGAAARLVDKVGEIRTSNTIVFDPEDRFFRLKFALPTFDDVKRITYAWKIAGVDDDWHYQKENIIQIGKLPYGDHSLRVKGQRSDGQWSPHELAIKLLVKKPFYLQYWFLSLLFLLLVGSIVLFFRIRTRFYRKNQKVLEAEVQKATSQIEQDKQLIIEQAKELRQLDKMKSKFFANISHELRTPLTLILGPISSVLKSDTLSNRNFTHLKKAQQNGKTLLKLIASILDLSKLESGKLELQEYPTLIFKLTRRLASTFESYAQQKSIQFHFRFQAEQGLQLLLDQEKLEVIMNNLLSNALKFTPADGEISVTVKDVARALVITVADTGRGVHPNDLPNIFDRFYQSKQVDTPTEGGTGIGLALSQEFAKMMGGQLSVESELGKGSIFTLELPRNEVLGSLPTNEQETAAVIDLPVAVAPSTSSEEAPPLPDHRPSLLIVEDNYSLRDYITSVLEKHYRIATAENGKKALDYLQQQTEHQVPCQLILSDIMMPEMDGYQLLEALKSNDHFRHLPVIMLTARADIQDKLKALRIGVDDYLLKPFEEEELLVRIDNLLQHQQARISSLPETVASKLETTQVLISKEDKQWLETFEEYIQQHLADDTLSVPLLAQAFTVSESSLLRQLKRLTGLSPKKYLLEARLTEARRLLENGIYRNVAQVATKVGYADAKAFSRSFKKRFGKSPSAF